MPEGSRPSGGATCQDSVPRPDPLRRALERKELRRCKDGGGGCLLPTGIRDPPSHTNPYSDLDPRDASHSSALFATPSRHASCFVRQCCWRCAPRPSASFGCSVLLPSLSGVCRGISLKYLPVQNCLLMLRPEVGVLGANTGGTHASQMYCEPWELCPSRSHGNNLPKPRCGETPGTQPPPRPHDVRAVGAYPPPRRSNGNN